MTPAQAALLIHAVGTVGTALWFTQVLRQVAESDPITVCDDCRDMRREWMTIGPAASAAGPWVIPLLIVAVSATWPVTVPIRLWRKLRNRRWRHVCDRPAHPQHEGGDHD